MNRRFVQELLNNYKQGFSLEQDFYTSNEVFEAEWNSILKSIGFMQGIPLKYQNPAITFFITYKTIQ